MFEAVWHRRYDVGALLLALLVAWGLLTWRQGARRGDGGLTRRSYASEQPGPPAPALSTQRVPTVDLDARLGPRPAKGVRAVRYSGWLWIPHRGYFLLALQLRGEATLRIADSAPLKVISGAITTEHGQQVEPRRLHKFQRLLDRGWQKLSLAVSLPPGRGAVRLLWLPPGRRGIPEYVEPGMLRPEGPKPTAPGQVGPAPRDRWVVLGLLALLLTLLGWWLRRSVAAAFGRLRSDPLARADLLVALGLLAGALGIRLYALNAAGQTWDEDVYFSAGRNQWSNLLALDFRAPAWAWNLEHPPVTRYLAGLGGLFTESMTGARALSALAGALVAPLAYLLGRDLLKDRRVGLVAALIACALPSLLAHSKIVGHEAPSVLLYTFTVWAMLRALRPEAPSGGWLLVTGIAGGLTVGCRLVNVTVWLLIVGLAAGAVWRRRAAGRELSVPLGLVSLPLVALATFWLSWPRLWSSPARHLGELLTFWHPDVHHQEIFLGQLVHTSWAYFPVYALVTTPTVVLIGLLLGLGRLAWRRERALGFLGLWLLAPLLITPLVPFCRDGIRYVLPLTVPLCLISAAGALWLIDLLGRRWAQTSWARPTAGLLAALLLAGSTAWAASRVHPYYLDFYNAPSGGARAALEQRRFEFSWWGEGLGPAIAWVNRHAKSGERVGMDVPARHTTVLNPELRSTHPGTRPAPHWLVYAGDGLRRLYDAGARRWRHPPGYAVVHRITVEGVPLVLIYRRR